MVDFRIGKLRIRNLELFMIITLGTIYTLAALIEQPVLSGLKDTIASLSSGWANMAKNTDQALLMAFGFATFGNTSVLIVFPYALIVWYIALQYPNWLLLGLVSGLGAGVGEVTSYLVGVWIGKSKKMTEGELGEKFYRLKLKLEKKPAAIPFLIFFAGATPLPDDMLLVPLGILKYPYKRVIFPCMLGKTLLCTIIALVGYLVSFQFPGLDQVFPISLIVPTEGVNPASDLISFSFVFWVIYLMVRLDLESISIKKSKERKGFLEKIVAGGSYPVESLISEYEIQNTANFREFLRKLTENYSDVSLQDDNFICNSSIDKKNATDMSFEFGKWLLK